MFDIKSLVSEGLLVVLLPALAYWLAFWYELGYLENFGLPELLITISIEKFFTVLTVLMMLSIALINLADLFLALTPKIIKTKWHLFQGLLILGLAFCVGVLGRNHPKIGLFFLLLAFVALLSFVGAYVIPFFIKKEKGYIQTLEEMWEKNTAIKKDNVGMRLLHSIGMPRFILILTLLVILPALVLFTGKAIAKTQDQFLVTEVENKPYALIRIYDDLFIFIEVKTNWVDLYRYENKFGKSYFFLPSPAFNYKEIIVNQHEHLRILQQKV